MSAQSSVLEVEGEAILNAEDSPSVYSRAYSI